MSSCTPPEVAGAVAEARLSSDRSYEYGVLPPGCDTAGIVERSGAST